MQVIVRMGGICARVRGGLRLIALYLLLPDRFGFGKRLRLVAICDI